MKKKLYCLIIGLSIALSFSPLVIAEPSQSEDHAQENQQESEPPKADSVWGAMKYSGFYIKKGSVSAGKGIKKGSIKAGKGIKKGGKATGRAFKKAGGSIKKFFVGGN